MLEIKMLGPLEVHRAGRPISIAGSLPRSVLGRLLVGAGRPVSAEVLIEDVWEGTAPATARKTLQKYISQLRRELGADAVHSSATGYALGVPWSCVDAGRFERMVASGDYDGALALWRGDPLADLGAPAFLLAERARLEELRLHALEQVLQHAIDDGSAAGVLPEVADISAAHPLRESLVRLHMVALYRTGRHVDALRVFDLHRRTLAEDIGVEPGLELRELEAAILRHDPGLQPPGGPGSVAPQADDAGSGRLPIALTSFIGRARDIDVTATLVERNRLVTIVGPGGIGKTRLALETCARLRAARPGGVWFVDVAPVRDGGLVADAVAAALAVDVREAGDALTAVTAWLTAKPSSVLLLDNCEHLVGACAAVVTTLLQSCAGLTVVATSRRPLGVDGEYVSPVPPMPEHDAVALFLDRAERVGAAVEPADVAQMDAVTRVCRAADGLPLAIELAASQLRVLAPSELTARLSDRLRFEGGSAEERQRNLHDMVAWSYRLLGPDAQRAFARLGVFVSSFTLEAAEAVCSSGPAARRDALAQITVLVDHSMLAREHAQGHSRYRLLETLRMFALERLDEAGAADETHRAHVRYHLELATRVGAHLYGREEVAWKRRLDREEQNLHDALRWAAAHDPALAFELAVALWPYWDVRWGERHAVEYLSDLLQHSVDRVPEELFAWGLTVAADLAANPGDARRSTAWAEEAVTTFRRAANTRGLISALVALGAAYANQARLDDADVAVAEAIRLGQQQGDAVEVARALNIASFVATRRGHHDAAYRINLEELELWQRLGSGRGQATALRHLAVARWYAGDLGEAEQLCDRALVLWETLDDPVAVAHLQTTLADIERVRGDARAARDRYEQALSELRSVGDRRCTASTMKNLGLIALTEGDGDRALTLLREALAVRHELGDTPGLAECLEGMALVHARGPSAELTAELLLTAAAIRQSSGTPAPPWETPALDDALVAAQAAISPDRLATLGAAASSMTADGIVLAYG